MSFAQQITKAFQTFLKRGSRTGKVGIIQAPDDTLEGDPYFGWLYRDETISRCILINAGFATLTAGFTTELEIIAPTPNGMTREAFEELIRAKYAWLLDSVNTINAKVNLDITLFYAVIKLYVYGKAAYLILPNLESRSFEPRKLLPLEVRVGKDAGLQPVLNKEHDVIKYTLDEEGETKEYYPEQVLYFAYLDVNGDKQGKSSLPEILHACKTRYSLRYKHYDKALERQWKMPVIASVNTEGLGNTPEDDQAEDDILNQTTKSLDSGNNFAVNKDLTLHTLTLKTDLAGMMNLEKLKGEQIIAQFGTAPFLVNQLSANFATAQVEFEAYISGPITDLQRFLKRALESDWYAPLMQKLIPSKEDYAVAAGEVRIKHVWRPAKKLTNPLEMVTLANTLWDKGMGLCGENAVLVAETAGLAELAGELQKLAIKEPATP